MTSSLLRMATCRRFLAPSSSSSAASFSSLISQQSPIIVIDSCMSQQKRNQLYTQQQLHQQEQQFRLYGVPISSSRVMFMSSTTSSGGGDGNDDDEKANQNDSNVSDSLMSSSDEETTIGTTTITATTDEDDIMASFEDTSYVDYDVPHEELPNKYAGWTNEDLLDTSTIPGWELIHSPPTKRQVPLTSRQKQLRQAAAMQHQQEGSADVSAKDASLSTPTTFVLEGEEYIPRGALVGKVVSTKMQKTINVAVNRFRIHKLYKKRIRYTRKFMAHDEYEVADKGDLVMIVPCQRISKHKHFLLREIIKPKGQL